MPALIGAGAAVASPNNVPNPNTLTPALPGGFSAGHTLLCYTTCRSATPTVATPSGWASLLNVTGTNGRLALFGKIAAGGDAAPSIVWSGMTTGTSGTPAQAQCAAFSDMQSVITGIVDVLGTVENGAASTATAAGGTNITTLTDDALVLSLMMRIDDAGTRTQPAGFTKIGDAASTSGADMSFGWAYQVKTAKGLVTMADWTLASASSFASTGIVVALKPIAPTAPVNTFAPAIFGDAVAGNTLSVGNGTWSGYPTPTYTHQWYLEGAPISGATSNLYFPVSGDVGKSVYCQVTATNSAGSASANSNTITPIAGPDETLIDNFNRADGYVYDGAGSTNWSSNRLDYVAASEAKVISNQLGITLSTWNQAVSLFDFQGDCDIVLDNGAPAGPPNNENAIWFALQTDPGVNPTGYCLVFDAATFWSLRRYAAGVNSETVASNSNGPTISAGDIVWIRKRGAAITVYYKTTGANWLQVLAGTSDTNLGQGGLAIEMSDPAARWDNLRGGPLVVTAPPRTATDSWSVSDSADRAPTARTRTAVDTVAISDSAVRTGGARARTATDNVAISDVATGVATKTYPRTASDSIAVSDSADRAPATRVRTAIDSIAISDSATRIVSRVRTASDAVAISDSVVRTVQRILTAIDSFSITDSAVGIKVAARSAADSVVISDTAVRAITTRIRSASDSVIITDSAAGLRIQLRSVSDIITISDSVAAVKTGTVLGTASDSFTISDVAAAVKVTLRPVADTVVVSDLAVRAPAPRVRVAADIVTVSDVVARAAPRQRAAVDSFSVNDTATGVKVNLRTATDTVAISDSALRSSFTRQRTSIDTIIVSDAAVRGSGTRQRATTDSFTVTSTATSVSFRIRSATDVIVVTDLAGGVVGVGGAAMMTMML